MLRTLWTSKTGMNANQEKLDAISNNIANVNTTGYKKIEVGFQDLLSESLDKLGTPLNNKSTVIGTGVKTSEWYQDINTQGMLTQTAKTTDIAVDGQGYFRVTDAQGQSAYTRNGVFQIDASGNLVDSSGNKLYLHYENGYSEENVKFASSNFTVSTSGDVYVKNGDKYEKVAEIPLYAAVGDNALTAIGNSLYVPVEGANMYRTTDNELLQGYLETSNVDLSEEFSDMIITQRAFQLSSKGVTTADEMWGMVNNLRS